jgi:hypothetical protein
MSPLTQIAAPHISDILRHSFNHTPAHQAVVVFDTDCELSIILADAYRACLPDALFINFNQSTPEAVLDSFVPLKAHDLVVLIQSTSFRLEAFRIRVELFKRQLKVIEHPHLARMTGGQATYYVDALAYDLDYYRGVGRALQHKINAAPHGMIDSGGEQLYYNAPFESAKVNIGDYDSMVNIGGQFPIGEVFTESTDLAQVNGRVRVFIFGDTTFKINRPPHPITLVIERSQVVAVENSTPAFDLVIEQITRDEGVVWVRELGFGMNRAFTKTRTVDDIGTYERMCGIHLSLGAKHGIYAKPGFKRGDGKYHVDIFVDTHRVVLGDDDVYKDGAWVV